MTKIRLANPCQNNESKLKKHDKRDKRNANECLFNHWRTGGGGGLGGGAFAPPQMKLNHELFSMYQQNIEIIAI